MNWVIAAIITPVPLFHLWLHALLPFWRKHPLLIYFVALFVWIAVFAYFSWLSLRSEYLFMPSQNYEFGGYALMALGACGVLGSFFTLGPKRFLVWAVLRPSSAPHTRIAKGIFHFIPHPAYLGHFIISIGNFLSRGQFYLLYLIIFLAVLFPIVIVLEEEELRRRIS